MTQQEFIQLKWLGNQPVPMWGGHLERNEPVTDYSMRGWIDSRLIQAVTHPHPGYILTSKGRAEIEAWAESHT